MADTHSSQDTALLARITSGDEAAFRELYDKYYHPLLYFAKGLIHTKEPAEDTVIVAFTKYWELRTQFNDILSVRAFLYTTVRNGCYRAFNQQQTMDRLHHKALESWPQEESFIESRMMMAEMVEYIRTEIDSLNPKYRDVIYLLFVEECSVKEAAERLDLTTDNVRKRKERAVEMLRQRIITDRLTNLALFYLILYNKLNGDH